MAFCHDWTEETTTSDEFLASEFLCNGREGSVALLINQHLRIVGGGGSLGTWESYFVLLQN